MPKDLHVNIGEIKLGVDDETLRANLGSCVGIAFLWPAEGKFGLAHCFLPKSSRPLAGLPARYVNHAVPALVEGLRIPKSQRSEIRVVVAGGGDMMTSGTDQEKTAAGVGSQNILSVKESLAAFGFVIFYEDLGGRHGRQIIVRCATADFEIIQLPRLG